MSLYVTLFSGVVQVLQECVFLIFCLETVKMPVTFKINILFSVHHTIFSPISVPSVLKFRFFFDSTFLGFPTSFKICPCSSGFSHLLQKEYLPGWDRRKELCSKFCLSRLFQLLLYCRFLLVLPSVEIPGYLQRKWVCFLVTSLFTFHFFIYSV